MVTTHPDVSEYQVYLDNSFTGEYVVCRSVNENGGIDQKIARNMAQAKTMIKPHGKLINAGTYIIPCIISNDLIMAKLDQVGIPKTWAIMIDMESWGGRVVGDHSAQLNDLATRLRARQGGRADLVWGYGNRNDLRNIWPSPLPWIGIYIAGYGGSVWPPMPGYNIVGWQYTNGVENGTNMPSGAAPFGNCDMNVRFVEVPPPTTESPIELPKDDDMFLLYDPIAGDDPTGAQYTTDGGTWIQRIDPMLSAWYSANGIKTLAENTAQIGNLIANINAERASRGWPAYVNSGGVWLLPAPATS